MADMQTPTQAYGQLDQAQRTQLAQEFVQRLRQEHDPRADQYAQMASSISAEQLAQLHDYVAQTHPGILGEVMKHPIITAALAGFGAYELDKHLRNR